MVSSASQVGPNTAQSCVSPFLNAFTGYLQWAVLAYLGIVASGLCFFLWNRGARLVSAGQLAVMNNLKIPLAVAVSLFVFREPANLYTFFAGTLLVGVALLPVRRD